MENKTLVNNVTIMEYSGKSENEENEGEFSRKAHFLTKPATPDHHDELRFEKHLYQVKLQKKINKAKSLLSILERYNRHIQKKEFFCPHKNQGLDSLVKDQQYK